MNIVNPFGQADVAPVSPVARTGLSGRMVGILINGKEYSDEVLKRLNASLGEAVQVRGMRFWDKGWPVQPAPFLPEIAREVDIVINGVGH